MQFQAEKEKSWKSQSWKDCSYCTVSNPAPLQGACTTVPLRAEVMLPAAPLPCARVVPWLWAVTKWACWQKTASIIGTQDVTCTEQLSFSEAEEQNCSNSRLTLPTGTLMTFLSLRALTHPNYSLAESHGNVLCCCVTTTEDLSPHFPALGLLTPDTLETILTVTVLFLFVCF